MKKHISIIFILICLLTTFSLSADATLTTGKARRTFKISNFTIDSDLQLQSFLVGFGIDNQSSLNLELTQSNGDKGINFFSPDDFSSSFVDVAYELDGPMIDLSYQYIPRNTFFVTPNSLSALKIGLRHYQIEAIKYNESHEGTMALLGLVSRSRKENFNLFSDFNISYDFDELWLFDSQVGLEYEFEENFHLQLSYKVIASSDTSEGGPALGVVFQY